MFFTKNGVQSLLDEILTNSHSSFGKVCNLNSGLSDVHNLIAFQLKDEAKSKKSNWINYRSFKNFDTKKFNEDIQANLSKLSQDTVNINLAYTNFSKILWKSQTNILL